MERFLDKVKVKFDENIVKVFSEVEIECVKRSEKYKTLNFYLVSHEIIPYTLIKSASLSMAEQLVGFNQDDYAVRSGKIKNPINIVMKYKLDDIYTPKVIFENIKQDLFKEIKDKKTTCAAFFRLDNVEFVDENKLQIKFDHFAEFKKPQDELVDILRYIFNERFGKNIEIVIQWLEYDKNYTSYKAPLVTNTKVNKNVSAENNSDSKQLNKVKNSGSLFYDEGDILFGKKSKVKRKFYPISSVMGEMENIVVSGIIYNIKKKYIKKIDKMLFTLDIYDGEGCIAVDFWGQANDNQIFDLRFKIGDEVEVEGKSMDDTYTHSTIIKASCITKKLHRDVIEFGKVGDDDYYNIIITDREDNEKEKRVELHLHTKSSAQDGIGEIKAYIDTAQKFGMSAMAITDHGCVNALADAYDYIKEKKKNNDNPNLKIINGVEGYLVEDFDSFYFDKNNNVPKNDYSLDGSFVIFEFVTTGYNIRKDQIIKIEASKIDDGKITGYFSEFVHIDKPLPFEVRDVTGIRDNNLSGAKPLKEVLAKFLEFAKDAKLIVINKNATWNIFNILKENGFDDNVDVLDLSILSRLVIKELKTVNLISIAKELKVKVPGLTDRKKEAKNVPLKAAERVELASQILIALFVKIKIEFETDSILTLKGKLTIDDNYIRRQKFYHIIILAKNDVGRVNLYKLVSESNIRYMYNKKPRMPRSLINKYREGLIIGSACILGEFMNAIKNGLSDDHLKNIASFYDYLEIQPAMNNSFLLNEDSQNFKSVVDLENLNKKVIEIADSLNKPVVATCDCHYVEKEDKIYREVLRLGSSWKKANIDSTGKLKEDVKAGLESSNKEELYFRTTKEMLDEFSYLGIDKAYEVVVTNSNLISNMVEDILPLRLDNCPPYIDGSEKELTDACYYNLNKIFGDNVVPEIIDRLDNELKYIIDNGYSVMYIAAKKLIDYSKENGYPVGSRGSVGSSLAATLSGVSEVNPLKPYYVCPKCKHLEYDTEETKKYENDTGFDMPDKMCPKCGTKMSKDGVNIPFETFLGIPGDPKAQKEPDIDLNFCSVYQSKIHEHTIELFGEKNTYKAGTVGTVAAKTAYGYVKRFEETTSTFLTKEQETFYRNKIIDCKNTTGQHPGGMVVVPDGEEIYTFTPIQLAADKEGNDITTHYDYHKIDKNLLKLDILGHDSPLMLKKLSSLTGVDFNTVPFYEQEVLNLFKNTESLSIEPKDISGTRLGCLTIPEFGTDFAMNMCEDAKPNTVADLIRIAGLAHGTDVWQGNVQDLIKNGDCTLSSAICCRDDIMIYLIDKGLDHGMAFNIMESVRKGKGLTGAWIEEMKKHDVPDWYINCCKKIKYMFPKAHAAAYVLASLRIAYFKIHYPKEYYSAYFSIKKDGFDYKLMMQDRDEIHYQIEKISRIINEKKSKDKSFEKKMNDQEKPIDAIERMYKSLSMDSDQEEKEVELDNDTLTTMKYESMSAKNLFDLFMCYRIVEEMRARGIDFCPIDIYKAKRSDFQVVDGKIMPSFDSIPGIGTKEIDIDYGIDVPKSDKSTAMKCELEGQNGDYTSIEDFVRRTGVNKTIVEEMKNLNLFGDIKESEKNTIFDYL